MAAIGLVASLAHPENGMIEGDMNATLSVADRYNEVIIFRSTGPWSKRWIREGYPTKNFHVKGKSSDWGPQAGFVPYLGKYSKVGDNLTKANKSTGFNDTGIHDGYAAKAQLVLSHGDLLVQLLQPEENPQRYAMHRMVQTRNGRNYLLFARRSGDNRVFAFKAVRNDWLKGKFQIFVYDDDTPTGDLARLELMPVRPLHVMTSSERGANNRPMTGDYDLMAVCPPWRDYMSRSTEDITKAAVVFTGHESTATGQTFAKGSFMDRVLDMRVNTGAVARRTPSGGYVTFQGLTADSHNNIMVDGEATGEKLGEHGDMGNLTPRILRCINALNAAMSPDTGDSPLRRVHHNAESHRHSTFGALQAGEMESANEGFPMTGFHPRGLQQRTGWTYGDVATLENMTEFRAYCDALEAAGYQVPRNSSWNMSVRNRFATFNPFPGGIRRG
ncbi:anthrax toxin-like adenylyl cyclase domain-containing protein [Ramlibacter albus]|uniref:Anthrax toxin edema factor central domain-containing protein n=1 Tax=Ramlibacter albus TaxID=2079448 RepID=A0A923S4P8_9BURK|nr:anthrax toxin-like adenylyl cyclase domain-containing protein [Ramlibacter albus]MBC5767735.1 hypothetical protein [Ramlibacter albus]